jgi:hypothetical protein
MSWSEGGEEEEEECSSCIPILFPQDTLIHYPPICVIVCKVIFPAGVLTKTLYAVLVCPNRQHAPSISSF